MSTAVIRTRGVIISSTVISSNRSALRTRLLSCCSRTPSSSISSIIAISSSSVTLTLSFLRHKRAIPFFIKMNNAEKGVNIIIKNEIIPEIPIQTLSAKSFARLLGITSPKINTTSVVATVAAIEPYCSPTSFIARIVAIDEVAIFTMLLPMRMVVNALSYFMSMFNVRAAPLEPLSAIFFSRIRLTLDSAVSDAEKNADINIRTTNITMFIGSPQTQLS